MDYFDEKTSPEIFDESFWNFISNDLVSNKALQENNSWRQVLTYKLWLSYKDTNVDISLVFNIAKDIIETFKAYEPEI